MKIVECCAILSALFLLRPAYALTIKVSSSDSSRSGTVGSLGSSTRPIQSRSTSKSSNPTTTTTGSTSTRSVNTASFSRDTNSGDLPPIECKAGTDCDPVQFPADINFSASNRSTDSLLAALKEECPLWDSSCKGNYTVAKQKFFGLDGTKDYLIGGADHCFLNGTSCDSGELANYTPVKKWMRTPECQLMQEEYGGINYHGDVYERTCCKSCFIVGGNVQVFYWPEPDTDKSCLSVVGDKTYPINYGATTSRQETYWGCVKDGKTITTAALITQLGLSFKTYSVNPWSSQPCPEPTGVPALPLKDLGSVTTSATTQAKIHGRGHTIVVPSNEKGSPITTAVSGSFTL